MNLPVLMAMGSLLLVSHAAAADTDATLEVTSLLGQKLYALPDADGAIRAASKHLEADPKNVSLILKLSKAQAAKRQYREAIATCTAGLVSAPDNAELYLERGHRELGLRDFKGAMADLTRAVEIDPKNLEAQYHLGMTYYFLGQFRIAAQSFGRALALAQNSDSLIDCANWRYVALRRDGQTDEGKRVLDLITPSIKNTEPHLFFYLQLLHFYQGGVSESQVLPAKPAKASDTEAELSFNTINYGVGNWHLYNDQPDQARKYFDQVVTGSAWNSWGFIGSELELSRK